MEAIQCCKLPEASQKTQNCLVSGLRATMTQQQQLWFILGKAKGQVIHTSTLIKRRTGERHSIPQDGEANAWMYGVGKGNGPESAELTFDLSIHPVH